ncbi:MAG: ion channel [Chloroflexota bacterium]
MKRVAHMHIPDTTQREALLHRIERATELPLLVLSFVMIPLLIGPMVWTLSPAEEDVFLTLNAFVWALFALDIGIKTAVATHRWTYLKKHWLEVLVVVVPFFRPLRILRIFIFGSRAWVGMRRLVNIDFLLIYGLGLVIIAATIVASVEGGPGATIHSFQDALWWSVVTITTVGYGDMVPVTLAGRVVGILLMLGGIAFFSGVTANLASFLVRGSESEKKTLTKLTSEIALLRQELSRLRPPE